MNVLFYFDIFSLKNKNINFLNIDISPNYLN